MIPMNIFPVRLGKLQAALVVVGVLCIWAASFFLGVYMVQDDATLRVNPVDPSLSNNRISRENRRGGPFGKHGNRSRKMVAPGDVSDQLSKGNAASDSVGNRPKILLMGGASGRLTTAAAEKANLTQEEIAAVDALLRRSRQEWSADFASRAIYDELASDPANGRRVYDIPARNDLGGGYVAKLKSELEGLVGKDKQQLLTSGLSTQSAYEAFGNSTFRLEFFTSEWGGNLCKITSFQPGDSKPMVRCAGANKSQIFDFFGSSDAMYEALPISEMTD